MAFPLSDPFAILTVLLAIEGMILFLSEHQRTKSFFKFLPSMFWIYLLPMVASSAGLIAADSPLYDVLKTYLLPACLVLLLLPTDVRAIARLGPVALGVMLAGSLGTMVGACASLALFLRWLPRDMWMGFASLSASWIGGSANMIAVKEALKAPDDVYLPMVVVDTLVPYAWMGMLIALSGCQAWYDRRNRSRVELIDELARRTKVSQSAPQPLATGGLGLILMVAAVVTLASLWLSAGAAWASGHLAESLPALGNILGANKSAWPILIATAGGIGLSFTPLRRLESAGVSKVGFFMLYLVLASIGARTNITHLVKAPILLLAGVVWILIHGLFIVSASRLLRAPMSLAAAASQANIGGPASAPVVAGIYEPSLAPVGLLLAVLGNILGTYLGFVTGYFCKFIAAG